MADGQVPADTYEPPRIEERAEIALPLIAGPAVGSGTVGISATFRPQADGPRYEPPRIEERTAIDTALIGVVGSPVGTPSAVFRPRAAYEPPRIAERSEIDPPLILVAASQATSAAFRPQPDSPGYEPPAIEDRAPISNPLIGENSVPFASAVFRPASPAQEQT